MKRGWIIMCILVFGIVGCKDFLNLVPKNKRVVANLEDVKTELLTYLAAITIQQEVFLLLMEDLFSVFPCIMMWQPSYACTRMI